MPYKALKGLPSGSSLGSLELPGRLAISGIMAGQKGSQVGGGEKELEGALKGLWGLVYGPDQGETKELRERPLADLRSPGPPGLPSGSPLDPLEVP